jgi:RNA polymerase sigma factor (sigma-70 family)
MLMRSLIRRLRTGLPPAGGEPTDERLLEDFLARRDNPDEAAEDAFAAIVRRHGPMVRGVCRRVLRNDADADDAYQAVFVVLIRKAESVRPRSQLGNWLYGVAVNVARRGRDAMLRRRTLELTTDPEASAGVESDFGELRAVIDQELSGLPDAYRAAVVACDLEGNTRSEAAARLGWSEGTVASRLARGRASLADRLTRRGVAIPAVGLAAVLGSSTADAAIPLSFHALFSGPPPATEALAAEAMKAMTTSKLKGVAVVLLAVMGLAGAGTATAWACGVFLPKPDAPASEPKSLPDRAPEVAVAKLNEPPAPKPSESPVWNRPLPKELPAFADKPGGDDLGAAGAAKPANFVMSNPAKDITIVTDRHEEFVEFFRRQPVMIATVPQNLRDKMLHDAKGVDKLSFVDNASFNVDGNRAAVYGASVKLAPVPPKGPVYRLLDGGDVKHPVVFVRDAKDQYLWHAVGFTRRSSFAFFASKDRVGADDFAPTDLLQEKPKDEKK